MEYALHATYYLCDNHHQPHTATNGRVGLSPWLRLSWAKKGMKDEVAEWVASSHILTCTQTIGSAGARPRWRTLPPEIIWMILQCLANDKATLRACSQMAQDFHHVTLSLLGRHLTMNDVDSLKGSTRRIAKGAFQRVRSLDLGVINKIAILEEYWRS